MEDKVVMGRGIPSYRLPRSGLNAGCVPSPHYIGHV